MAYHAINKKRKENKQPELRVMFISPVLYKNGWPEVIKTVRRTEKMK